MGGCCENRKENYHIQFDFRNTQNSINQNSKTFRENKLLIQYKLNEKKEVKNSFKLNTIEVPSLDTKMPNFSNDNNNVSFNINEKKPNKKNLNIEVEEHIKLNKIPIKKISKENKKRGSLSAEKNINEVNKTEVNKIYFPFDDSLKYFENTCTNESFKCLNNLRKYRLNVENKRNDKLNKSQRRNLSSFKTKTTKLNSENDDFSDFNFVEKVNLKNKENKQCT